MVAYAIGWQELLVVLVPVLGIALGIAGTFTARTAMVRKGARASVALPGLICSLVGVTLGATALALLDFSVHGQSDRRTLETGVNNAWNSVRDGHGETNPNDLVVPSRHTQQQQQQATGPLLRSIPVERASGLREAKVAGSLSSLIASLKDQDAASRKAALVALGRMGTSATNAVPAIIVVLRNDDHLDNREMAATALGQIGPAAKEAVAALKEAQLVPRFSVKYGGAWVENLYKAAKDAQAKIEGDGGQRASRLSHEVIATEQPDMPGLGAPALKNGLLIDRCLSLAVSSFRRHVAAPSTGIFSTDVDGIDMTLAFRRVGSDWPKAEYQVIITDDRGNEYLGMRAHARSRVLYGGALDLTNTYGTPPCASQMPIGFTWITNVKVQMPPNAPVAKVEMECTFSSDQMFQRPFKQRVLLSTVSPTAPDFAFKTPDRMALAEDSIIVAGRDIRGKIGRLRTANSFKTRGFGPQKTVQGLELTLPIELTNTDYNDRTATVPRLAVQFANGQVLEASSEDIVPWAEIQGNPRFLSGATTFTMPGSSTHTLLLHVDIEASMKAMLGSRIRAILLYVQDTFCGFVRIRRNDNTNSGDFMNDAYETVISGRGDTDPGTLRR